MILNNAFTGAALFRGMWWWWGPPALALIILFVGLFLISIALDEYANPRLRGEGTMIDNKNAPVLTVEDLQVFYWTKRGPIQAVDGVSFTIQRNERFGFIGESGCGKTTTMMAVLRLIKPPGKIENGRIMLDGRNILEMNSEELRQTRWRKIALVPQGAMNSLNPTMRIGDQIADTHHHA